MCSWINGCTFFQVLSVDETVKNVKADGGGPPQMPAGMGRGMGRPMMGWKHSWLIVLLLLNQTGEL